MNLSLFFIAALPVWVTFDVTRPEPDLISLEEALQQEPVVVVVRNPTGPCCERMPERTIVLWVPPKSGERRPPAFRGAWLAVDRHGLAAHELGLKAADDLVAFDRQAEVLRLRLGPSALERLKRWVERAVTRL